MRRIEIDSLDEAALVELNARIVERLQDIRVGSGVTFKGRAG